MEVPHSIWHRWTVIFVAANLAFALSCFSDEPLEDATRLIFAVLC